MLTILSVVLVTVSPKDVVGQRIGEKNYPEEYELDLKGNMIEDELHPEI